MLNASVDGRTDRSGGLVPLGINDRLEPLPENRPPLFGPPEAEIEISPSDVGMVDLYITTGKMKLGVMTLLKLKKLVLRLTFFGSVTMCPMCHMSFSVRMAHPKAVMAWLKMSTKAMMESDPCEHRGVISGMWMRIKPSCA